MKLKKRIASLLAAAALVAAVSGCSDKPQMPAPPVTDASSPADHTEFIKGTAEFQTETESNSISTAVTTAAKTTTAASTRTAAVGKVMPSFTAPADKGDFTVPDEVVYKYQGESVSGDLVQVLCADLTYDGESELIGKYYSFDKDKYFYRVYDNDGGLLNTVISPADDPELTSECVLVKDENTDSVCFAWFNIRSSDQSINIEYYDLGSGSPSDNIAAYSYGTVSSDRNSAYLNGSKVSLEKCLKYIRNICIIDDDERDLGSYLNFRISEPNHTVVTQPAVVTTVKPTEPETVPVTQTVTTVSVPDHSEEIAELNRTYSSLIDEAQERIDGYTSDPNYNPQVVDADPQAYRDAAAELSKEQASLERSGDLAGAAEMQETIDKYNTLATQAEFTQQIEPEIARFREQIEQYRTEWDNKLAALQ